MNVTLRQRKQGKRTSLYLDYYEKGKRKTEYLKIYLDPYPITPADKEQNRKNLELAKAIRAKRQVEIQNQEYGFQDTEKLQASFIDYVEDLAERRHSSEVIYASWDGMFKHLRTFAKGDITFRQIDERLVEEFKFYLDKQTLF